MAAWRHRDVFSRALRLAAPAHLQHLVAYRLSGDVKRAQNPRKLPRDGSAARVFGAQSG
jgi:hypothetical protein